MKYNGGDLADRNLAETQSRKLGSYEPREKANLRSFFLLPFLAGLIFLGLISPSMNQCQAGSAESDFVRGDATNDGLLNLTDVQKMLDYLFYDEKVNCTDALDCNDDGKVDITDPVRMALYLFGFAPNPVNPFPECGPDLSADNLDCLSNQLCDLGGPIMGLEAEDLLSFWRGREVFQRKFKPSDGLGPFYNSSSCVACHQDPVVGGSSPIYRNFYMAAVGFPGNQFPLQQPVLPSIVVPSFNIEGTERPRIPATFGSLPLNTAQRNAPPIFGTGLFEQVSDAEIMSHADPNDDDQDGISGRYNKVTLAGIVLGRFGYKLQANFVEAFNRGALNNQMGITTDAPEGSDAVVHLAALQVSAGFDVPTVDTDNFPDPEMPNQDVIDLSNFCRFIAPVPQLEKDASALNGEILFDQLGCTKCHLPTIESAVGPLEAYTDLLLHDMGPDLADGITLGVPQAHSGPNVFNQSEFRTQPLWGVRFSAPYLHDGRAATLDDAIRYHGGEAESIKDAYEALSTQEQQDILAFLEAI